MPIHISWAIFDLDSTLIQQETIDELARFAGKYDQVALITQQAMQGEWDFQQSLQQRCNLLKGLHKEEVWKGVLSNIKYTDGVKQLFSTLKQKGVKTAIVSGGFTEMVEHVGKHLGADYVYANKLEYDASGHFTGNIVGPIVDGNKKRQILLELSQGDAIAVGDGANDIPMLAAAKVSIAFMGKPAVRDMAEICIDVCSFCPMIEILDELLL